MPETAAASSTDIMLTVSGQEKQITAQKWQEVDRVAWLSDGSGLVTSALETGSGPHQIWYIPYSGGEARRVTSDLNNYGDISLTADSKSLAAIQFEQQMAKPPGTSPAVAGSLIGVTETVPGLVTLENTGNVTASADNATLTP